jgi:precorrin-6Y C5,15-methyltransferase (decarboxylating)
MVKEVSKAPARHWGLPDDAFEQRRPLRGQITKREVRAVSLYLLGLKQDSVVWDLGAGTGSVAIEASLVSGDSKVYAVERDESSVELLKNNVQRWGTDNIRVIVGEAPDVLSELPDPDSVFVGGSGGKLGEILDEVARRLKPSGRVVVNLAALERTQETYHRLKGLGFSVELVSVNAARGKEMKDGTVRLEALNPVFIISAYREGAGNE